MKKGFTLIELMIVIAIISILASIIIPNIQRARFQANVQACGQNLKAIGTAFEMYSADHEGNIPGYYTWREDIIPEYLSKMPVCPAGAGYWWGGAWTNGEGGITGIACGHPSNGSGPEGKFLIYTFGVSPGGMGSGGVNVSGRNYGLHIVDYEQGEYY
ncbi:MAG: type II secretion system protein [Vulcanimicrobiota bacterium]